MGVVWLPWQLSHVIWHALVFVVERCFFGYKVILLCLLLSFCVSFSLACRGRLLPGWVGGLDGWYNNIGGSVSERFSVLTTNL